jgi:endonuclease/exonuclease/phosphatase family metal-dependent hydrolase
LSHVHAPTRRVVLLAIAAALLFAFLPVTAPAHGRGHEARHAHAHEAVHPHQHGHGKSHGTRGHGNGGHRHHGKPHGGHGKAHGDHGRGKAFDTMTRNLYLGANLAPAIESKSLEEFVAKNGQILREVTANDFPVRAQGLASEILEKKPDLIGLQEVALWRTGPVDFEVLTKGASATTVRYDYLQELLGQLNKVKPRYEVVVSQDEFDFEAPADEDENPATGPFGADVNGRLTMRDVILKRHGAGVQTANPSAGHFVNLLPVDILGNQVPVTRGWVDTDAKVRGSHWFRFVNTHLEAFDPAALVPSFRAKQAAELVAPDGPASSDLPVILVGDLNSDDDTVEPGDRQAYETLIAAGMVERSTNDPLGCCLKSSLLAVGAGGSEADFDHQVDHIMTRDPGEVLLRRSAVTGIQPVNGFWNSDHAGLFSALRFRIH